MFRRKAVLLMAIAMSFWAAGVAACQGVDAEITRRFDRFIEQAYALWLAPGLAVTVVRGDEVVYLKGFGYADVASGRKVTPETVFYIASSTKSFTGLAASLLHERGELDLDAPLSRYLPRASLGKPLSTDEISLRDLLTHTHGIDNNGPVTFRSAYSGAATHERMVELLAAHGPAENGRAFAYSNIGYNVASLALDETLGVGWKDLLEREIFEPAGMTNTTGYVSRVPREKLAMPYGAEAVGFEERYYAKSDENMHAAGGLVTTASDLAKWLELNLNEGRVDGRQVVAAEAVREAHRPQAEQDNAFGEFKRTGYGLGWNTGTYEGDTFLHHFGGFSGFHSHVSFMPEHEVGVAVLVNEARLGSALAVIVARYIYDTLLGKEGLDVKYDAELEEVAEMAKQVRERIAADRARRAARPQTLPYPLSAYAGVYENPEYGRVELELVGERLEARMGPLWSEVEVYDHEKNALRVELTGGGTVAVFEFNKDGEAMGFRQGRLEFTRVR